MRLLPKIVLAVLAPVLVGAAGALVVLGMRLAQERRVALTVADSQLQLRAVEMAAQLRMRREALRLLAASPVLLEDDAQARADALMAWSGGSSLFSSVVFQAIDEQSTVQAPAAAPTPSASASAAAAIADAGAVPAASGGITIDADELAALRSGRDDSLVRPQASSAGPSLQQLVAVRDAQGQLAGVLAGSMNLGAIVAPAPQQPPAPGVRWLLLDSQARPLAEPPPPVDVLPLSTAGRLPSVASAATASAASGSASTAASTAAADLAASTMLPASSAFAASAASAPSSALPASAALARAVASAPLLATPLSVGGTRLAQVQDLWVEGNDYKVLSAPVMGTDWRLVYAQQAAVVDAAQRGPILRVTTLMALVLGVSFLGALWVRRQVAQPLSRLRDAHARVQSGDLQVRAPERGHGELADLERSFNRMAEGLAAAESKFRRIFEAFPHPVVLSRLDDGRYLDVNPAFEERSGHPREKAIGRTGIELGLIGSTEPQALQAQALQQHGRLDSVPVHVTTASGRQFWSLYSSRLIELHGDAVVLTVGADITPIKEVEEHLQAAQAELRELNETLEARVTARTQELGEVQAGLLQAEKLASLGALVAGVAHELNTPIGNAVMVASTLADHQREFETAMAGGLRKSTLDNYLGTTREAAQVLERNLRRAAELVGSFKQLAVDQSSYQRRRFELGEVLQEVLLALSPTLRRSALSLRHDVPAGLQLDSYPGPLGQVLVNLISNALVHAFDDGAVGAVIEVHAGRGASDEAQDGTGRLWLRLRDNGRGIAEADLGRIFDPFFTTRLGQGGSGLGLHIVYKLVTDLLGGRIQVHSSLGSGTEFVIDLPDCAPKP